jgi:hypothetical protein
MTHPSKEEVRILFRYDQDAGELFWNVHRRGVVFGTKVGSPDSLGYLRVGINLALYRVHQIIWLLEIGEWPKQIDHINGIKSDNRIVNLRIASNKQNAGNVGKRIHNTSGYKGVVWDKAKSKWIANITIDTKVRFLGRFEDIEDAAEAYRAAAKIHFGEFARFK